jgi:hypothetical protein
MLPRPFFQVSICWCFSFVHSSEYILTQAIVFQVLNIPTKINKGTVEIITPVELIKKGEKVGSSESALLAKLGTVFIRSCGHQCL